MNAIALLYPIVSAAVGLGGILMPRAPLPAVTRLPSTTDRCGGSRAGARAGSRAGARAGARAGGCIDATSAGGLLLPCHGRHRGGGEAAAAARPWSSPLLLAPARPRLASRPVECRIATCAATFVAPESAVVAVVAVVVVVKSAAVVVAAALAEVIVVVIFIQTTMTDPRPTPPSATATATAATSAPPGGGGSSEARRYRAPPPPAPGVHFRHHEHLGSTPRACLVF